MAAESASIHRLLASIGLKVGGPHGFALAGGYAIAAHGILDRRSEDVDLFADWQRRTEFPAAVDDVIAAYQAEGFNVRIDLRTDAFARLCVTDVASPTTLTASSWWQTGVLTRRCSWRSALSSTRTT